MEGFFNIGKIVGTHGVRGEVKIYPYTDDLDQFGEYAYLWVEKEKIEIESTRVHKNMVLIKFKGFKDANAVMPIINKLVYIERDMKNDDGNGHYIVDLIGCRILSEAGEEIGVLKDVLQNTSQDIYLIKRNDGKGDFMLPVVDAFVKKVDIENKCITVSLIEGLLE